MLGRMSTDHFQARIERDGDRAVVRLDGELDMAGTFILEPALDELVADPPRGQVVIDLRGLDFIDSTGLTAIIGVHERLRQAGVATQFVRGSAEVQRVFTIAGFDDVLDFVDAAP
jgi:anti-anti-sigma factor